MVAMEMYAVGLPSPPAGSAPLKWLCPRLDALRKLLAHRGVGGRVSGEGGQALAGGRKPCVKCAV